jgi:signal transduction histidine kinase
MEGDSQRPSIFGPAQRMLGIAWVAVSLPVIVLAGTRVETTDQYVFVLVFMASGAYTTPGLIVGWMAVRNDGCRDAGAYKLVLTGLALVYGIGLGMLVGIVTGWTWGNALGPPATVASGAFHMAGLGLLIHRRSGQRSLAVDLAEAMAGVVAVIAPLVVLWGPAVLEADARWFALPAALGAVVAVWGLYWTLLLFAYLTPEHSLFEGAAVALAALGAINGIMQTANAVNGFTLPAGPLIGLHAAAFSTYLLIPLNVPAYWRPGLSRLPPQDQMRSARLTTVVPLVGVAGLTAATAMVADERSWALPFSLAALVVLCVLGAARQLASLAETRRLHALVSQSADHRRQLLTQVMERSVQDRHRFASALYERSVAAYTSFRVLSGAGSDAAAAGSYLTKATALVGDDLARQAESVRKLALTIRPADSVMGTAERISISIMAHVAALYGDDPAPTLRLQVDDELTLDWVIETVVLQVVQASIENVREHSRASSIEIALRADDDAALLSVQDDGDGFDPVVVPEGAGITGMRAAAAVLGGTLVVSSGSGEGTQVTARFGPASTPEEEPAPAPSVPHLRLVKPSDT